MSDGEQRSFATRAVHGRRGEPVREHPVTPPIYQTASFAFDDAASFAAVAQTKISGGYLYSRWANPTVDDLAAVVADLEGTEAAACFASGMGAIYASVSALVSAGDHIVSAAQLYGGTHGLFAKVMPRAGVEVTLADVRDHKAIERAFRDRTRVLYCEVIGNPTLPVADVERLAEIAHAYGAFLVVDATFATPYLLRPASLGADVVVHAATKYLGGHSDVTAGVVAGNAEIIARIRHLQIDTGGVLAPFEAWLTRRGIETLPLRMERASANAFALAHFLERHPRVRAVVYPGLPSHPEHELATALFGGRYGALLAVDVEGGVEAGRRVMERLRVALAAASLGGTKTLVVHPASVTHTQLTPEQRLAAGITDGMLRISVGIEDEEDIVADFDQALRDE